MYELRFDKKAIDFLNKLEKGYKKRIWNKLQLCKETHFIFSSILKILEVLS